MELKAPCLLVASPELIDPNFKRTVVLLSQHSGEGSLGFVLNRPIDIALGRLLKDPADVEFLKEENVFLGGPVQVNSGMILFVADGQPDHSTRVQPGLHLTGSFETLRRIQNETGVLPTYRLMLGYAGWGDGQLEWEIMNNSWFVLNLDIDEVMRTPAENLWERSMARLGVGIHNLVTPDRNALN